MSDEQKSAGDIPLNPHEIMWDIGTKVIDTPENGVQVELSWGWTAGMTDEEISQLADDCPTGRESVLITVDEAGELGDKLKAIHDEWQARDATFQAKFNAEMKERLSGVDLRRLAGLDQ